VAPFKPEHETGADVASAALREEMRSIMTSEVGVQRTEASLLRAQRQLARLARVVPSDAWRTANQVLVARLITRAARHRRESRGGHRRLDYPPQVRRPEPAR
jgi:L-aspartate oxidase